MESILAELSKHAGAKGKVIELSITKSDAIEYDRAVKYMIERKDEIAYKVWRYNSIVFIFS
jgi:hypothetical protein